MKHIESSVVFVSARNPLPQQVKDCLVARMRSAFHVETVGDGSESFSLRAAGRAAYAFDLNVLVRSDAGRISLVVDGRNDVTLSARIFYVLSLLLVLAFSLLPAGGDGAEKFSSVMKAMLFLIVCGFIIYDTNRKLDEPQQTIDRILQSVAAEFA